MHKHALLSTTCDEHMTSRRWHMSILTLKQACFHGDRDGAVYVHISIDSRTSAIHNAYQPEGSKCQCAKRCSRCDSNLRRGPVLSSCSLSFNSKAETIAFPWEVCRPPHACIREALGHQRKCREATTARFMKNCFRFRFTHRFYLCISG